MKGHIMTKLTKTERKLLITLDIMRTAFVCFGIMGFIIMLGYLGGYENNINTFKETLIGMIIGAGILAANSVAYQYITNIHNDTCDKLYVFSEIENIVADNNKNIDYIDFSNTTPHARKNNFKNYFENDAFNLRKLYGDVDKIPESKPTELKFTPIVNGRFVK